MSEHVFTSDNPQLSRVTKDPEADASAIFAVNCKYELPEHVAAFVQGSLSDNTRRAYLCDLNHFASWGGAIPATPETVASYLAQHAEKLAVASLVRRVASISIAHEARGLSNPTRSEIVRSTLRGIKRQLGTAQRQAKPLLREDLFRVLDALGDGVKDVRDRALLLLGFAGGFRRSELVGLDVSHIERVRQGFIVHLRRSKTDQEGAGRKIGVPLGRTQFCPVQALDNWLEVSGIDAGALFRPVDRHGRIVSARLSGDAVSVIVRETIAGSGLDPSGFSGHSLRAGFATSAALAGVAFWRIRRQTGHTSDAMLGRYIRDNELFTENAAGALL